MRTLSSLLGREVTTPAGVVLGRCHDLRAELTPNRLQVVALCIGEAGFLARLGIRSRGHHEIEWTSIVRIEGGRIIVRDSDDTG
jgi:sporulation protein YlmC with PRC-barrel domain